MPILFKTPITGFLAGLALPPLITKLWVQPALIQAKFDEIDKIKNDIDHAGWHVRNMEEQYGVKEDEIYVPISYFQGHY